MSQPLRDSSCISPHPTFPSLAFSPCSFLFIFYLYHNNLYALDSEEVHILSAFLNLYISHLAQKCAIMLPEGARQFGPMSGLCSLWEALSPPREAITDLRLGPGCPVCSVWGSAGWVVLAYTQPWWSIRNDTFHLMWVSESSLCL